LLGDGIPCEITGSDEGGDQGESESSPFFDFIR